MEYLEEFCESDKQREYLRVYREKGSYKRAAKELGISKSAIFGVIKRMKIRAEKKLGAPSLNITHDIPETLDTEGISLYKKAEGNQPAHWLKLKAKKLSPEKLAEAFNELLSDFEPIKLTAPEHTNDDIMTVYPMGDPHIGLLSWHEETGEDYDLEIATNDLRKATKYLVDRSPSSTTALILNLGDFFHSDNMDNRTSRSGNSLDVDGRWYKVLRAGVDVLCEIICAALEKHDKVLVRNMTGNHDDHSAAFLNIAVDKFFSHEPRVSVDLSGAYFWYHTFGKNLIGSTHGNTAKPEKLPQIMAADKPSEWGNADYRYWYTGHIHSRNVIEFSGCVWESFRTLAAKDAWHAGAGYRSGREMNSIVLHKDYGEIGRFTAPIKAIREQS